MNEKGFTMLEVLVSLTIFAIISTGLAQAYVVQLRSNTGSEIRAQGVQAVQRALDQLRTQDITALPTSGTGSAENIVVDGKTFAVTVTYCPIATYCSTSQRSVRARATFRNKIIYEVDTVFAQLR